jgi:hypothetical protein
MGKKMTPLSIYVRYFEQIVYQTNFQAGRLTLRLHLILLSSLIFDSVHTNFDNKMKLELIKIVKTKLLLYLLSHYEHLLK